MFSTFQGALLVSGLLLAVAGPAVAQTETEAYRQALEDYDARPDVSGLCAYTLDIGEPPARFAMAVVPDGSARWDGPSGHDLPQDADAARTMVAVNRSMFDSVEPVHLLREEEGLAVFAVHSGAFTVSGMGRSVDISEQVTGEVAVNLRAGRFAWVRYYAPESFKPTPVARFERFDHLVELTEAWQGGPLVRTGTHSDIVIRAFFQTHDQGVVLRYDQFQACVPAAP